MRTEYSPNFYRQYKKADVRIRNKVDECIIIFKKNPHDFQLNNHPLKREYKGKRSIDITADWRAVFEEIIEGEEEPFVYFIALDTHKKLYR